MSSDPGTRLAILNAAEHLFASQGYARTTTKAIGTRARVNPALLYYYFGDKAGLYRACLERLIADFARRGGEQLDGVDPREGVRRLVAVQVEYLSSHPTLVQLLVREMLDHQGAHARELIATVMGGTFRQFAALIARGQEAGIFRRSLDPTFAAFSTIGQMVYFMIAQPAIRLLLAQDGRGRSPELPQEFGRHAAAFALAALEAPPQYVGES